MAYYPPHDLIRRGAKLIVDGFLYLSEFLPSDVADELFEECKSKVPWDIEIVPLFGKNFIAPRLSRALADSGCTYRYRGSQLNTVGFTKGLDRLRKQLEKETSAPYNYILANRYRCGNDYVGWHSDDERDLGQYPVIASLSLGETRKFRIASKTNRQKHAISMHHGSLLVMYGNSQSDFKHTLSKTKIPVGERINLSFRYVLN